MALRMDSNRAPFRPANIALHYCGVFLPVNTVVETVKDKVAESGWKIRVRYECNVSLNGMPVSAIDLAVKVFGYEIGSTRHLLCKLAVLERGG